MKQNIFEKNQNNFIPLYKQHGTRKTKLRKLNQKILKKKFKRLNQNKKNVITDFQKLIKKANQIKKKSAYPQGLKKQFYTQKLLNQFLEQQQDQYLEFLQEKGQSLLQQKQKILKKQLSNATKSQFQEENKQLDEQIIKNQLKQLHQIQNVRKINQNSDDNKAIFDQQLAYFQKMQITPEQLKQEQKNIFRKQIKNMIKINPQLINIANLEYNDENQKLLDKIYQKETQNKNQKEMKQINEQIYGIQSTSKKQPQKMQQLSQQNKILKQKAKEQGDDIINLNENLKKHRQKLQNEQTEHENIIQNIKKNNQKEIEQIKKINEQQIKKVHDEQLQKINEKQMLINKNNIEMDNQKQKIQQQDELIKKMHQEYENKKNEQNQKKVLLDQMLQQIQKVNDDVQKHQMQLKNIDKKVNEYKIKNTEKQSSLSGIQKSIEKKKKKIEEENNKKNILQNEYNKMIEEQQKQQESRNKLKEQIQQEQKQFQIENENFQKQKQQLENDKKDFDLINNEWKKKQQEIIKDIEQEHLTKIDQINRTNNEKIRNITQSFFQKKNDNELAIINQQEKFLKKYQENQKQQDQKFVQQSQQIQEENKKMHQFQNKQQEIMQQMIQNQFSPIQEIQIEKLLKNKKNSQQISQNLQSQQSPVIVKIQQKQQEIPISKQQKKFLKKEIIDYEQQKQKNRVPLVFDRQLEIDELQKNFGMKKGLFSEIQEQKRKQEKPSKERQYLKDILDKKIQKQQQYRQQQKQKYDEMYQQYQDKKDLDKSFQPDSYESFGNIKRSRVMAKLNQLIMKKQQNQEEESESESESGFGKKKEYYQNQAEILKNGINIDFLQFLIQLQINMFKKRNNAKYLQINVVQIINGQIPYIEQIIQNSDIIIFIILIDSHFSTIYYDKMIDSLNVCEPLVNYSYRKKLFEIIEQLSFLISPQMEIKVKMNGNKIQSDDNDDKNLCGIYSILFAQNQLNGLTFAQSTNFDKNEKEIILTQTQNAEKNSFFDFI